MFGHVAQMPQLLRLAGLEHAVVWRGVPAVIDRTAFWWRAPDGSTVRAEYLYGSYSNGRDIPKDPAQLVARARGYDAELGAAALPGGDMLLMNGSDHLLPQPWLGEVVAAANTEQDEYRFAVTSLGEYVRAQPTDGLSTWDGELRSGARANVLMGVASNRVDVHQLVRPRRAQPRALRRTAVGPPARARRATRARCSTSGGTSSILNSAHDSSCACSADDVVEAVRVRYQEARHVGEALTREAVRTLATTVDVPAVVHHRREQHRARRALAWSSVPLPGTGPVHLVALDDGTACPTQVVHTTTTDEGISTVVVGQKIRWVLEMMRGPELAGARIARVEHARPRRRQPRVHVPRRRPGRGRRRPRGHQGAAPRAGRGRCHDLDPPAARAGARRRRRHRRGARLRLARRTGRSKAQVRPLRCGPRASSSRTSTCVAVVDPARRHRHRHRRRRHRGRAQPLRRRRRRRRHLQLLATGDRHRRRPPGSGRGDGDGVGPGARPHRGARHVLAAGRERSATSAPAARAATSAVATDVVTTYELRTGERFLRVHVELDHRVRDHRLRAHFPLPTPVTGSDAECAFAVVHRGLTAEGGPHEFGLPTFVSRRFVDCSGTDDGARGWVSRSCTTACSSTRSSARGRRRGRRRHRARAHAGARHRIPVAVRARAAAQSRRPARPRSRVRSCRRP